MNELKPDKVTVLGEDDWGSRSHIRTLVLMAVTVAGIYFCYLLTAPFLPALAWALALAVLFALLCGAMASVVLWFSELRKLASRVWGR